MKRWFAALAMFSAVALTINCGGGIDTGDDDDDNATPSPTASGFLLESGGYDFTVTEELADTCWQPPKTNVEVPLALIADITSDGIAIDIRVTIQDVPLLFTVTKDGDNLSGTGAGDLDLNAAAGIDCIVHVEATMTGTMNADNTFTSDYAFDLTEGGGGQCALAVGTSIPDQLDSLPCALSLRAEATRL